MRFFAFVGYEQYEHTYTYAYRYVSIFVCSRIVRWLRKTCFVGRAELDDSTTPPPPLVLRCRDFLLRRLDFLFRVRLNSSKLQLFWKLL
jgi:hypothetical protein